jgi:hypothetical protein
MFTEDCNEPDDALIAEGTRRVRASMPSLTPEQVAQWVADSRRRGARFVLVPGGLIAEYEREGSR